MRWAWKDFEWAVGVPHTHKKHSVVDVRYVLRSSGSERAVPQEQLPKQETPTSGIFSCHSSWSQTRNKGRLPPTIQSDHHPGGTSHIIPVSSKCTFVLTVPSEEPMSEELRWYLGIVEPHQGKRSLSWCYWMIAWFYPSSNCMSFPWECWMESGIIISFRWEVRLSSQLRVLKRMQIYVISWDAPSKRQTDGKLRTTV